MNSTKVSFRIPDENLERMDQILKAIPARFKNRSVFINEAINEMLDQFDAAKKERLQKWVEQIPNLEELEQ